MERVPLTLILLLCLVGCIQVNIVTPGASKVPSSDNKTTQTMAADSQIPSSTSVTNSENAPIPTDAMQTALRSTVLVFSTNQLVGDKAKGNFWDEISQYQNSVAGRKFGNIPDINKHYWTQGTGVIIDKKGYILTNRNNLECDPPCDIPGREGQGTTPQCIYVFTYEQGRVSISPARACIATVVGKLPHDDLALIKIVPPKGDLPYVSLGDSDTLKIGQKVTIIDYSADALTADPSNISPITAEGTISSMQQADTYPINYYVGEHYTANVIQMSAPVDRRSKGGPVINRSGELIGLIISRLIYQDNLGFAIAINEAKDLIKTGGPSLSSTPPTTISSASPSTPSVTPALITKPVSWGDSATYINDIYNISFMYPKTWVKMDPSGDQVYTVAVSSAEGADNASLTVVAKTDDIAKAVKVQYDIALSSAGVQCDIVSANPITLADGKTPATEVSVVANIGEAKLSGYALAISKGGKLIFITANTFGDAEKQAFVREIASTLASGTDSSTDTSVQSPDPSKTSGSGTPSSVPPLVREAPASLTISYVKYEIAPKGFPVYAYDIAVMWTTSVPSTSEVSYIRSDEGFSNSSYTLTGQKFGEGCPETYTDSQFTPSPLAETRNRVHCVNKITYVNSDPQLVIDHKIILHDLFKDTETSEAGINKTHQNFSLKVTGRDASGQSAESTAYSFKLE